MDVQLQMFECVISFAILSQHNLLSENKIILRRSRRKKLFQTSCRNRSSCDDIYAACNTSDIIIPVHTDTHNAFIRNNHNGHYHILSQKCLTSDRGKIGAFMIASSFGSSALLGYPFIQMVFPNNPEAMTDAILISEIGVGLPLFILCPLVAMWFGKERQKRHKVH